MAKTIKFKDDLYLDTKGIMYNKKILNDILNNIYNMLGLNMNSWKPTKQNQVGDIETYDGKFYENLTGINTSTSPDNDKENWKETSIFVDE